MERHARLTPSSWRCLYGDGGVVVVRVVVDIVVVIVNYGGDSSSCVKKPVHYDGCDTYSCSTFGCRDKNAPDDTPFPSDDGTTIGILTDDDKALKLDSSLNNWLNGETTGILSNPRPNDLTKEYSDINSDYKYKLKPQDHPKPAYGELNNQYATTYTCQLSNGTKTPDIIKTTIPCKYFINNEKEIK